MNLTEAKSLVTALEGDLLAKAFIVMHTFERDDRKLHLALTDRLRRSCRRGRVWKSKAFLTAIKNAQYGFDESQAHSPGGSDGIFVLTRQHRPPNDMMKKMFDRFLDRPDSGIREIAEDLGSEPESLIPVRLVSHHLRLLGVMKRTPQEDTLVLIDYDDRK